MTYQHLLVEDQDAIRIIKINRPKALNALNRELLLELDNLLHETALIPAIQGVILTGEGERAFVAGADIKAMQEFTHADAYAFASIGHSVFQRLEAMHKPILGAINGIAFGGGLELALCCDFLYASDKALFALPEVKLGLIPGFGGTQRLMRKISPSYAREMIYTGEPINAEEALRIGLINRVLPPEALLPTTIETLQKIIARSRIAISSAKKLLSHGADIPLAHACSMEISTFSMLFSSDHPQEGMKAFLEKRTPDFSK